MEIKNKLSRAAYIAATGERVAGYGIVSTDDDLGAALLEQVDRWAPAGDVEIGLSIEKVLAQVADDPDRARSALDAENATDKPRTSLVDALTKIIDTQEGEQT